MAKKQDDDSEPSLKKGSEENDRKQTNNIAIP